MVSLKHEQDSTEASLAEKPGSKQMVLDVSIQLSYGDTESELMSMPRKGRGVPQDGAVRAL